jgi:hypothetical protein
MLLYLKRSLRHGGGIFGDVRGKRHRQPGCRVGIYGAQPVIRVNPALNEESLPEFQSVDRIGWGVSSTRRIVWVEGRDLTPVAPVDRL